MIKVIAVGRLTGDPEVKEVSDTFKVARFSLAVDRAGDKDEEGYKAGFFNVEAFNDNASFAEKYLKKGSLVTLDGSLRHHVYEDNDGKRVGQVILVADRFGFINTGGKKEGSSEDAQEDTDTTSKKKNTKSPFGA